MTAGARPWAKSGFGQLLMKVGLLPEGVQVLHAVTLLRSHKPLTKGTLSKATAAWGSLRNSNVNETPIQSLLELSQQLFGEIHLEVPRPAFAHAMRCVPQACRRGPGPTVSSSCQGLQIARGHRMVLRLLPLWHKRRLTSETCSGRRADLQQGANHYAAAAQSEAGIISTCICVASFGGLRHFLVSQNQSSSQNFVQVARCRPPMIRFTSQGPLRCLLFWRVNSGQGGINTKLFCVRWAKDPQA